MASKLFYVTFIIVEIVTLSICSATQPKTSNPSASYLLKMPFLSHLKKRQRPALATDEYLQRPLLEAALTNSDPPDSQNCLKKSGSVAETTLQALPAEKRQRPLIGGNSPSWSNPPQMTWIDDPPTDSVSNLLPILYLIAPLIVTALLMPIGATFIAGMVMASNQQGGTKAVHRAENLASNLMDQSMLFILQKLEEALPKYKNDAEENVPGHFP